MTYRYRHNWKAEAIAYLKELGYIVPQIEGDASCYVRVFYIRKADSESTGCFTIAGRDYKAIYRTIMERMAKYGEINV